MLNIDHQVYRSGLLSFTNLWQVTIITLFLFCTTFTSVHAQSPLPEFSYFYFQDIPTLYNAAAEPGDGLFSARLRYGSYTGPRSVIREMYADARARLKEEDKISFGVLFYNQDQGPFIHLSRFNGIGSYSIIKNENKEIRTALNFGFINYSFEGNDMVAGGSDIGADASASVYVKWFKWGGGISLNHLINEKLQPLGAAFVYDRNLQFSLQREFLFLPDIKWTSMVNAGWYLTSKTFRSDWANRIIYLQHYGLIVGLKNLDTYTLGAGVYEIKTKAGMFAANLTFSGYVANKPPGLASNRYEIGISYLFKR